MKKAAQYLKVVKLKCSETSKAAFLAQKTPKLVSRINVEVWSVELSAEVELGAEVGAGDAGGA